MGQDLAVLPECRSDKEQTLDRACRASEKLNDIIQVVRSRCDERVVNYPGGSGLCVYWQHTLYLVSNLVRSK